MNLNGFTPSTALLTILAVTLAPFVAVMVTSFTKIVVTLGLVRNALGLQQTPPNIVINGLALILSAYVMYPVGTLIQDRAASVAAAEAETSPDDGARLLLYAETAREPIRTFLIRNSNVRERAFFLRTVRQTMPAEQAAQIGDRDLIVVVPAFTVTELTAAFQIGFLLFLPFLVIDLVVSNILMSLGMMMLSPTTISLPFKLLLFVLVDGWAKLSHGLVQTYV